MAKQAVPSRWVRRAVAIMVLGLLAIGGCGSSDTSPSDTGRHMSAAERHQGWMEWWNTSGVRDARPATVDPDEVIAAYRRYCDDSSTALGYAVMLPLDGWSTPTIEATFEWYCPERYVELERIISDNQP